MFRESLAVLTTYRLNEELQSNDVIDAAVYAPKVRQSLVAKLAEDAELMRRGAHVAVESITPRCAPVSQNGKGIGVEGMLTELRAALDGVVTRKPRVAIYENSEGLWRQRGGETRWIRYIRYRRETGWIRGWSRRR